MQHSKEKCIKPKTEHNWYYVALVLGLIVLYTALFKSNVGNVSDTYAIEVTPAGWVFSIVWTIIFIWQVRKII